MMAAAGDDHGTERREAARWGAKARPSGAILLLITAIMLVVAPLGSRLVHLSAQLGRTGMLPADEQSASVAPSSGMPVVLPDGSLLALSASLPPDAGPAETDQADAEAARTPRLASSALARELSDLSAELRGRLAEVQAREQDLALREATVKLVEERVQAKLEELGQLAADIARAEQKRTAEEEATRRDAAKIYEAMKAKAVAEMFNGMPVDQIGPVARVIQQSKLAAIIAEMNPEKSRELMTAIGK